MSYINKVSIEIVDMPDGSGASFRVIVDPPDWEEVGEGDKIQPCLYLAAKVFDYLYSGAVGEAHEHDPIPANDTGNIIKMPLRKILED